MVNARFSKKTCTFGRAAGRRRRDGSTLVLALTTITLLAIMAAYTLRRVAPKFRMASQAAGWQESRLAAEAGVDVALWDLQQNAAGAAPETWSGWTQSQGATVSASSTAGNSLLGNTLGALGNTLNNTSAAPSARWAIRWETRCHRLWAR